MVPDQETGGRATIHNVAGRIWSCLALCQKASLASTRFLGPGPAARTGLTTGS